MGLAQTLSEHDCMTSGSLLILHKLDIHSAHTHSQPGHDSEDVNERRLSMGTGYMRMLEVIQESI